MKSARISNGGKHLSAESSLTFSGAIAAGEQQQILIQATGNQSQAQATGNQSQAHSTGNQ